MNFRTLHLICGASPIEDAPLRLQIVMQKHKRSRLKLKPWRIDQVLPSQHRYSVLMSRLGSFKLTLPPSLNSGVLFPGPIATPMLDDGADNCEERRAPEGSLDGGGKEITEVG
mmetsp:Transcript_21837/g.34723  ORF Transcript_21837/g.34723 Transcript_21837/m.34723 type:complete len:113 (+) Transcript_21837:11-349(+)